MDLILTSSSNLIESFCDLIWGHQLAAKVRFSTLKTIKKYIFSSSATINDRYLSTVGISWKKTYLIITKKRFYDMLGDICPEDFYQEKICPRIYLPKDIGLKIWANVFRANVLRENVFRANVVQENVLAEKCPPGKFKQILAWQPCEAKASPFGISRHICLKSVKVKLLRQGLEIIQNQTIATFASLAGCGFLQHLWKTGFWTHGDRLSGGHEPLKFGFWTLFSLAYVNQLEFRLDRIFSHIPDFFGWTNINKYYKKS
jgi:hypothetical protein